MGVLQEMPSKAFVGRVLKLSLLGLLQVPQWDLRASVSELDINYASD